MRFILGYSRGFDSPTASTKYLIISMNTRNLQIVRTLLDVSVIVTLTNKSSFQIYGQIANGTIEEASIFPALAEGDLFFDLPPEEQKVVLDSAYSEFKKFC